MLYYNLLIHFFHIELFTFDKIFFVTKIMEE